MRKPPKKDMFAINAAALQDHIMRTANLTINRSRMANFGANIMQAKFPPRSNSREAKPKGKFQFEIEEQAFLKKEEENELKKQINYNRRLTLAQKLGLVEAPPQPMSLDQWREVEEQSKKRDIDNGVCPICLDKFRAQEHVILSCSHVFHKNCLESFEKYNRVKVCPICRRQDYEKKNYIYAKRQYAIQSVILIQKSFRGYNARRKFFEMMIADQFKPISVLLRRKLMYYKLSKVTSKVQKSLDQRQKRMTQMVEQLDQNYQVKKEQMEDQMSQLKALKEVNHLQYEEVVQNHVPLEEQKINDQLDWNKIKEAALKRCDKECSICFQTLKNKKGLYLLSCSHIFHANCLAAFERYSVKEHQNCPLCRQNYTKQHFLLK